MSWNILTIIVKDGSLILVASIQKREIQKLHVVTRNKTDIDTKSKKIIIQETAKLLDIKSTGRVEPLLQKQLGKK